MPQSFLSILSLEEQQKLKDLYETGNSLNQLSKVYKKAPSTILLTLQKLGVEIRSNKTKLTQDDKFKIKKLYEDEKLSIQEIANIYNVSITPIRAIMKELNIIARSLSEACRVYNIDIDFFKIINTEEKAYWLGFLYADGYITEYKNIIKGFKVSLKLEDRNHLDKLKKSLKSEHLVIPRCYNNEESAQFEVGCKEMGEDLTKLGCYPNKSLTLKYPTIEQVPLEFQHHFIRGYFDGDGSLSYSKQHKRYNSLEVLGTKEFLIDTVNFLQPTFSFDIDHTKSKGNNYRLRIHSKEGILDFYNKIYKNSNFYLDRKYDIFNIFLTYFK